MNSVHLVGHLGADPEVKTTTNSTVANLRVATSSRRKDKDGNWNEETEWHRVTVWGKAAESCGRFLRKGRLVGINGELRTRKWQDKDGNDRYSTEVVADFFDGVEFLGGKDDGGRPDRGQGQGGGRSSGGGGRSSGGGGRTQSSRGGQTPPDDDIPFATLSPLADPMGALALLMED